MGSEILTDGVPLGSGALGPGGAIRFARPTVQDLELLTSLDGVQVGSIGLVTGSGNLYWATTATPGGSTWRPASGERTFVDFGADPSGATDSTAAIVEALAQARDDGGGDVVGEEGSYLTSSQMRVEDRVRLRGRGRGTRIVSTTDLPMVFVQGDDVVIENLAIEGSGNVAHTTQAAIRVSGIRARAKVRHVWLISAGAEALRCSAAANALIDSDLEDIYVSGCTRGIEFANSPSVNVRVRGVTTRKDGVNMVNGIAFTHDATDILIIACNCEAFGFGISIAGIQRVTIRDCECFGCTDPTRGEGIHLETSNAGVGLPLRDVLVEGCRSHDNLRGIVFGGNDDTAPFRSCERVTVRNCQAFDNALTGIYGFDFVGATVCGNDAWGNGRQGIYMTREEVTNTAADLLIEENRVYDNNESASGYSGLEVGGGVERFRVARNIARSGVGFGSGTQIYGILNSSSATSGEFWDNVTDGNANPGMGGAFQGRQILRFQSTDGAATEIGAVATMIDGDAADIRIVVVGTEVGGVGRVRTVIERTYERTAGVIGVLATLTNVTTRGGGFATAGADLPTNANTKQCRVTGEGAGISVNWVATVEARAASG